MTVRSAILRLTLLTTMGLGAGCQHAPSTMSNPWMENPWPVQPAGLYASCSTAPRDAVAWGTLPSAWCFPYDSFPYWSQPIPGYSAYGRGLWRPWRQAPGYYAWRHPGPYGHRGYRFGGFRLGRGRR